MIILKIFSDVIIIPDPTINHHLASATSIINHYAPYFASETKKTMVYGRYIFSILLFMVYKPTYNWGTTL